MKAKTNDISVMPVKKYTPPKYPTLADAQCAPLLLRKLPSRWEKNAKVIAAIGLLGVISITSCRNTNFLMNSQETTNFLNAEYDMPGLRGGYNLPPSAIYEQDALNIIKNMLESEERFNFKNDLTKYPDITNEEIKLYDFDNKVAIGYSDNLLFNYMLYDENFEKYVNYDGILMGRFGEPDVNFDDENQQRIYDEYIAKHEDINKLFYSSADEDREEFYKMYSEIREEYVINIKPFIEENLRAQVRDFIEWLQSQGII